MWMDSLLQDTLIRDRIADLQRQAARRHLLRDAKPSRASRRSRTALLNLPMTVARRLKRRIERMAFQ